MGSGGDEEDRTPDLGIANAALSQLSYVPMQIADFTRSPAIGAIDPRPGGLHCVVSAHERPAMQITPPFGYREIVPLQKTQAVKLPSPGVVPEFCASTNAMPISFAEFRVIAHDYPIVFASGDNGQTYAAVAVVGLANGENLFVREGVWGPGMYVPGYVRRHPFCMARVTLEKKEQANRLICVEKSYLAADGEKLFDDKSEPLAKWQNIEKLLREYEADLERTREMCAILGDYALLEPFTLQATETNGAPVDLSGMCRVKEDKFKHRIS